MVLCGLWLWGPNLGNWRISEDYKHSIRFQSPEIVSMEISAKDLQDAQEKAKQVCNKLVSLRRGVNESDQEDNHYKFEPESNHLEARYGLDKTWFSDYYINITNPQGADDPNTWTMCFRNVAVTSMRNKTRVDSNGAISINRIIRGKLKEDFAAVKKAYPDWVIMDAIERD